MQADCRTGGAGDRALASARVMTSSSTLGWAGKKQSLGAIPHICMHAAPLTRYEGLFMAMLCHASVPILTKAPCVPCTHLYHDRSPSPPQAATQTALRRSRWLHWHGQEKRDKSRKNSKELRLVGSSSKRDGREERRTGCFQLHTRHPPLANARRCGRGPDPPRSASPATSRALSRTAHPRLPA